jgi:hypothetical protein
MLPRCGRVLRNARGVPSPSRNRMIGRPPTLRVTKSPGLAISDSWPASQLRSKDLAPLLLQDLRVGESGGWRVKMPRDRRRSGLAFPPYHQRSCSTAPGPHMPHPQRCAAGVLTPITTSRRAAGAGMLAGDERGLGSRKGDCRATSRMQGGMPTIRPAAILAISSKTLVSRARKPRRLVAAPWPGFDAARRDAVDGMPRHDSPRGDREPTIEPLRCRRGAYETARQCARPRRLLTIRP